MSENKGGQEASEGGSRSKALTTFLLLAVIGMVGGFYYFSQQKAAEIYDLEVKIINGASEVARFKGIAAGTQFKLDTLREKFEGKEVIAKREWHESVPAYEPGSIVKAWNRLLDAGRRFQGKVTDEEFAEIVKTQDLNETRGPDLSEIMCLEALLVSGRFPLLEKILQSNMLEVKSSGDAGKSLELMPELVNLLAFYLTMGDKASVDFLEEFLTKGQLKLFMKTDFNGIYMTSATSVIIPEIESCLQAGPQGAGEQESE